MARRKFSPLSTTFTLFSMLGFVISVMFVSKWSETYAFTFSVLFICMFIASFQSMRYANPDDQLRL